MNIEQLEMESRSEFSSPQAAYTTVLVAGATGRVGRVLVRKLLLRGYKARYDLTLLGRGENEFILVSFLDVMAFCR